MHEGSQTKNETQEAFRLPSVLRTVFEQKLEHKRSKPVNGFQKRFELPLEEYDKFIVSAFAEVLGHKKMKAWMESAYVDVLTWHYKTRHADYQANTNYSWFSGQITVGPPAESPYPGKPSPYIDIFGSELHREKVNRGGPVCIVFLEKDHDEPTGWREEWTQGENFLPMLIPFNVTECLLKFTRADGERTSLTSGDLEKVRKANPEFIERLVAWMTKLCPKPTNELKALSDLFASIKVTRKLLKNADVYKTPLPRSTFVCPAYVGGEEIGGIAFACSGFVSRNTTLIGEQITSATLSYLRLREDSMAHNMAQDLSIVDQMKQLLLHRVVHDLRHPADALESMIREQEVALQMIKSQLHHLTTALDETLVSISGSDSQQWLSGKAIRVRKNRDSVAEFIADVEFLFRKRFEQREKCLEVGSIPKDWNFRIDGGLMREILDNLLNNALEHAMKKGGQKVRIDIEQKDRKYFVHVRDDGPGIPSGDWENMFRPFYSMQIDSMKGRVRGQGLAISRILAKAHGGNLELVPPVLPWKTDFCLTIPS